MAATSEEKTHDPWTSFDESPDSAVQGENEWTTFSNMSQRQGKPPSLFMTAEDIQGDDKDRRGPKYHATPKTAVVSPIQKERPVKQGVNVEMHIPSEQKLQGGLVSHAPNHMISTQYIHNVDHYKGDHHTMSLPAQERNVMPGHLISQQAFVTSQAPVIQNRLEQPVYSTGVGAYSWTKLDSNTASGSGQHRIQPQFSVDKSESDPWQVTEEQRDYYTNQFAQMQPHLNAKIDGQTARNFFTKSRLPIPELSHIWELCDVDQDGHLTLDEFCAAFHLVVARKNGYDLPPRLPQTLMPPLPPESEQDRSVMGGFAAEQYVPLAQQHSKSQDKWETFSERTSSSTTLANFEECPPNLENLAHPIAIHVTPHRQDAPAQPTVRRAPARSTDDADSSPPYPARIPNQHRSLTNPYGSLTNDLSETDNGFDESQLSVDHRRTSRSSSSSMSSESDQPPSLALKAETVDGALNGNNGATMAKHADAFSGDVTNTKFLKDVQKRYHKAVVPRKGGRTKTTSNSSCETSDRSSSEGGVNYHPPVHDKSDHECSDWSSRPLRPLSGSDSSAESPPPQSNIIADKGLAPTPPPRPIHEASVRGHGNDQSVQVDDGSSSIEHSSEYAPTPPPRSEPLSVKKPVIQQERFADFDQFTENSVKTEGGPKAIKATSPVAQHPTDKPHEPVTNVGDYSAPVPAKRSLGAEKSSDAVEDGEVKDKRTSRKAPSKPPRNRILSVPSSRQEPSKQHSFADDDVRLPDKPVQKDVKSKTAMQQSIRDLKLQNSQLTLMNGELQQELKDVMQSRISIEMSIHQLRPFSQ